MIGIVFDGGESVEALVSQNALRAKFCWTNHDPEEKMLSWRKKSKDKPIRLSEEFFVSDRSFLFFCIFAGVVVVPSDIDIGANVAQCNF